MAKLVVHEPLRGRGTVSGLPPTNPTEAAARTIAEAVDVRDWEHLEPDERDAWRNVAMLALRSAAVANAGGDDTCRTPGPTS